MIKPIRIHDLILTFRSNHRTPFELNTTSRLVFITLYETHSGVCAALIISMMPCLLIGSMLYLEAFFLDIESLFVQMDRLSERKISKPFKSGRLDSHLPHRVNLDLVMLERCKEVVDLHKEMNRYCIQSTKQLTFAESFSFSD